MGNNTLKDPEDWGRLPRTIPVKTIEDISNRFEKRWFDCDYVKGDEDGYIERLDSLIGDLLNELVDLYNPSRLNGN